LNVPGPSRLQLGPIERIELIPQAAIVPTQSDSETTDQIESESEKLLIITFMHAENVRTKIEGELEAK
jgi:hypothetical protein